jgi:hypothetical protein
VAYRFASLTALLTEFSAAFSPGDKAATRAVSIVFCASDLDILSSVYLFNFE